MSSATERRGSLAQNYLSHKHFLQKPAWAELQQALGKQVITRSGCAKDGGSWHYQAIVERGRFSSRLYCPYGPTVTTLGALDEALASLSSEARSYCVEFVRVEPWAAFSEAELVKRNLKPAARSVQPPDTVVYDIRADAVAEDEIIMRASSTRRQRYRYNLREGVEFKHSSNPADISCFLNMIHEVATRTGMQPHPDHYFTTIAEVLFPQRSAGLLFSVLEGKPIASMIYYADDVTLGYAHAASVESHRKLSPPTGLLMYAQLFARKNGFSFVDTYGVAPVCAGKDHPWAGFTKFKESFGGERVSYLGTWELPCNKIRYAAYRLAGKVLKSLR